MAGAGSGECSAGEWENGVCVERTFRTSASWHCPQNLTAFGAPDYDLARFLKALVLSRLQTGAPGAVSGCALLPVSI